jgi:hypothetical protein
MKMTSDARPKKRREENNEGWEDETEKKGGTKTTIDKSLLVRKIWFTKGKTGFFES